RLSGLAAQGKRQCRSELHVASVREFQRGTRILSCLCRTSEQRLAQGDIGRITSRRFFLTGLLSQSRGPARKFTRFFKRTEVGGCPGLIVEQQIFYAWLTHGPVCCLGHPGSVTLHECEQIQ